jgi:hypothetical protein
MRAHERAHLTGPPPPAAGPLRGSAAWCSPRRADVRIVSCPRSTAATRRPRPGCAASMIVSTVPTRLPAAGTRRAIQRSCCRCTWPLVQSSLAVGWAFGTPLSAQDSDRYVTEMMVAAEFVGVPRPVVPASVADLERYVASVRPELRCTPAARESMAHLLDPPRLGRGGRRVLGKRRDKPAWRRR